MVASVRDTLLQVHKQDKSINSKTCVKLSLKNRQTKGLNDKC